MWAIYSTRRICGACVWVCRSSIMWLSAADEYSSMLSESPSIVIIQILKTTEKTLTPRGLVGFWFFFSKWEL